MTRLLVSVRDGREAAIALAAGAALIDVKEPRRGSLGAAEPEQMAEVLAMVANRAPVSAALGELLDDNFKPAALPDGLQFAKLGLSRCTKNPDWSRKWSDVLAALPAGVRKVAVVYADWQTAGAPSPTEVLRHAEQLGCAAVLIDTFDKSQSGLLQRWPLEMLSQFTGAVRDKRLMLVLAGSLTAETFPKLLPLEPDYLAVRGAACRGDRGDAIDGARVERLVRLLDSP
jgi:uncharacterized protein (UPF0264 family)